MEYRIFFFGLVSSFLIALVLEPILIPILQYLKFGQIIRKEGPQSHITKRGTPTMGGIAFILSASLTFIIGYFYFPSYYKLFDSSYFLLLVMPFFAFALIGLIDDLLIVARNSNHGLKGETRLVIEIIISLVFFYYYLQQGYSTEVNVFNLFSIDFGWLYGGLVLLILVGSANGVNLTDGLDGLAAGTSSFALGAFAFIAIFQGQLLITLFISAVIGGILGFLLFNTHPAKVFMGDTGSLSLGAFLGTVAIMTKQEVLLIIIGAVFVIETLSVIIQSGYFKLTKKLSTSKEGKRIFRMAPIHHHFELLGLSEGTIVFIFWVFGFVCAIIGMLIGTL